MPSAMANRLGHCRIVLVSAFDDPVRSSQWSETKDTLEISIATAGSAEHDVAMELLLCLGQALWERISAAQREAYWKLLDAEISEDVRGEIDEETLESKTWLLANRETARSLRRLERYGHASFAATAAEYVHCLWHDVTVRTGQEHLPAAPLRARLNVFARWFPPNSGYRLFPRRPTSTSSRHPPEASRR